MKNKKGFTLVELLATIAIMLLLVTIAVPAITNLVNRNSKKVNQAQEEEFISLAKIYMSSNSIELGSDDEYLLSLQDMLDIDLISSIPTLNNVTFDYNVDGIRIYKNNGKVAYEFVKNYSCDTTKYPTGCSIFNAPSKEVVYDDLTIPSTGSGGVNYDYLYNGNVKDENVSIPNIEIMSSEFEGEGFIIPIVYDESCDEGYGCWRKADTTKVWYDYSKGIWANVALVNPERSYCTYSSEATCYDNLTKHTGYWYKNAKPGIEISMDDISGMYVWIPRFDYKIEGDFGIGGTSVTNPGKISIQFNSDLNTEQTGDAKTSWYTHPAFKKEKIVDTASTLESISGFWVAKFEGASYDDSVPFRYESLNFDITGNDYTVHLFNEKVYYFNSHSSHEIYNFEWAAIAYLSQSNYGIANNNSCQDGMLKTKVTVGESVTDTSTTITGIIGNYTYDGKHIRDYTISGNKISNLQTAIDELPPFTNRYKGYCGSTTGTIYGVYDMAGGYDEYVGIFMKNENDQVTSAAYYKGSVKSPKSDPTAPGTCDGKDLSAEFSFSEFQTYTQYHLYDYVYCEDCSNEYPWVSNYYDYPVDYPYKKGDATKETENWFNSFHVFIHCQDANMERQNNGESHAIMKRGRNNIFDFEASDGYSEVATTTRRAYY